MKLASPLNIELAELIREMRFSEPLPDHITTECNFVAYRRNEVRITDNSVFCPFFADNQRSSEEQNFLQQAHDTLTVTIQIFDLITAKYGSSHYPHIDQALTKLRPAENEFTRLASLDQPMLTAALVSDPLAPQTIHFGYHLLPGQEQHDQDVYEAICDFFLIAYLPYGSYIPISSKEGTSPAALKQKNGLQLFPNSKQIDQASYFCIAQIVGNAMNGGIKYATLERAKNQYKESGRKAQFVSPGKNSDYTLELDPVALDINSAAEFAKQLMKIKDAKVLQTFWALWKYANDQDSHIFRNVPISKVMKIVLKPHEKANFTKKARQEFTKGINYLAAISISVYLKAHETNKRGKKKPVLVENKNVHLLDIQAQYALKKEFQHLPEKDLTKEHYDRSVINKFSGELLPGNKRLFADRANVYSSKLLQLNANKDRQAVVLGFILQTRFNQLADKEKSVRMQRGYLIEQCEYQKSDKAKPAVATKYLKKVLDKLQLSGIISHYENLTNNSADEVRIYPPVQPSKITTS